MKKEVILVVVVIALTVLIFASSTDLFSTKSGIEIVSGQNQPQQQTASASSQISPHKVTLSVPAVDNEGNGVATTLTVQSIPGEGRILTNINALLFWVDTQYSIQTAKAVAENITNVDTSNIDLIYTIETNASLIEGPSAGAALTAATIAVLENKTLNPQVAITGTINPDGSVGPVGGILAKAKASKDAGAKIFLVPKGQGVQTNYLPETKCEKVGSFTYCKTEYQKQTVNITSESGIEIAEIGSIQDALKYFLV